VKTVNERLTPKRTNVAVENDEFAACTSHIGVLAAAAFPATGMALASGPIARSKTGEHDLPFRGQCRSTTRALPHATEMAQPADKD
jgi:hypothetical protein